jgi:hypothetical protein
MAKERSLVGINTNAISSSVHSRILWVLHVQCVEGEARDEEADVCR